MAMTASLKEMVRPVSIPPPFERSCGALMQVSFGRPSSHTTKKLDRVRRDASIHRESEKGSSRQLDGCKARKGRGVENPGGKSGWALYRRGDNNCASLLLLP
jgi:hypothetical protein